MSLYIFIKNTDDLQSDQTGEALEDVYIKTADAVIGQVSVTHKNLIEFFHILEITT